MVEPVIDTLYGPARAAKPPPLPGMVMPPADGFELWLFEIVTPVSVTLPLVVEDVSRSIPPPGPLTAVLLSKVEFVIVKVPPASVQYENAAAG